MLRASFLLKQNIDYLLKERRHTQKALARWCGRDESWLSHLLRNPNRGVPLKYLDRIADFFGIATYQLFQPGIAPLGERRKRGERRGGKDRRISRRDFTEP